MDSRIEKMKILIKQGKTQTQVALLFNVSRQRVHQLITGYRSPSSSFIPVEKLKHYNNRKKESLGLPIIKNSIKSCGRDHFREIIRARDNWTCQLCGKKWIEGARRFDVHHDDESLDGRSKERGICKLDKENADKLVTLCHKCHLNLPMTKKRMKECIKQYKLDKSVIHKQNI